MQTIYLQQYSLTAMTCHRERRGHDLSLPKTEGGRIPRKTFSRHGHARGFTVLLAALSMIFPTLINLATPLPGCLGPKVQHSSHCMCHRYCRKMILKNLRNSFTMMGEIKTQAPVDKGKVKPGHVWEGTTKRDVRAKRQKRIGSFLFHL